jgi:hypothetical protein
LIKKWVSKLARGIGFGNVISNTLIDAQACYDIPDRRLQITPLFYVRPPLHLPNSQL